MHPKLKVECKEHQYMLFINQFITHLICSFQYR
uniref:Uncharacterized protein n=1 Tax=Arundo donax TaxID=35708 RepID=A0A0A9HTM1_ARUDO